MSSADIRFVPDPGRRWDRAVLLGSLALLMFSILAFGATEPWAIFVVRTGTFALLVIWALGRAFAADAKVVVTTLFYPMALFMLLIAAQWAWLSAYRYATMMEGMNYIAFGVLLFLAVQCTRTEADARRVVVGFSALGALLALEAIWQGLSGTDRLLFLRVPRVAGQMYGPYVNHNHYAGMMEMVVPFLIVCAASDRLRGPQRIMVGFAALLAVASIFLSRSRGGMLAFLLEAAFLAVFLFPASAGRRSRQTGALAVVLLVGFLMWLAGGAILERLGSIGDIAANRERLDIARDSLRMFMERPLLGWGLGTFPVVYPPHRSFFSAFFVNQAHNDYAQLLVETGVVGFAIMLWYLFTLFRRGLPKVAEVPLHSWSAISTLAALAGCVGIMVHSFFDFNLHVTSNAALFFFIGGIAVAEVRTENKQARRRPEDPGVVVN